MAWGVRNLISTQARSYARRKQELELERAVVVQEQCTAAREKVKEFQAHFVTKSGKRFVSIDRLRSHEECRDDLVGASRRRPKLSGRSQ